MAMGAFFSSRDEEILWLNRSSPQSKQKESIFKDHREELEWLDRAVPKSDGTQGIPTKDFRPKIR